LSLVADIVPGGYGSNPGHFAIFEDKLYFSADGPEGDELRVYDGNVVSLVADVTPWGSSSPSHLAVFDGRMYFAASDFPGPVITLNTELWAFDGATASKVEDINPTFDSNNVPRSSFPKGFTAYGDYLYFMADDGIHGYELWRLKSSPMLEINAVAISPFEKFWEWPVDMATQQQREVEVATFAVPAEGRAHLIRRSQVQLGKVARNPRLLGATLDVSAERMECFALATVVFDAISGERLGQGIDFVDVRQAQECRALQRQANAFTAALTLERIRVWQP
jgi:ELWxxDGT repeat protein